MHKSECKLIQENSKRCQAAVASLKEAPLEEIMAAHEQLAQALAARSSNADRLVNLGVLAVLASKCQEGATGGMTDAALEALLVDLFNVTFTGEAADWRQSAAADAGVLEAAVAALRAHAAEARIATKACKLIRRVVDGDDEAAIEVRCKRATAAGAIEAVVAAMSAGAPALAEAAVLEEACAALCILSFGLDNEAAETRSELAAKAGAIELVVAAITQHATQADVQIQGCSALANLCAGFDEGARARRERAIAAGGVAAVEAAGDAGGRGKMAMDVLKQDL